MEYVDDDMKDDDIEDDDDTEEDEKVDMASYEF